MFRDLNEALLSTSPRAFCLVPRPPALQIFAEPDRLGKQRNLELQLTKSLVYSHPLEANTLPASAKRARCPMRLSSMRLLTLQLLARTRAVNLH
jgi:hypothetical protein